MAKESLRGAYGATLIKLGEKNPDIVVLDADLAKSTQTIKFGNNFPDRFIDFGLSEQDMISTAAGLSLTGKIVLPAAFAYFWQAGLTTRCVNPSVTTMPMSNWWPPTPAWAWVKTVPPTRCWKTSRFSGHCPT